MSDATALGSLPEWDLDDLYPGQDSPELEADLKGAAEDSDAAPRVRPRARSAGANRVERFIGVPRES